VADTGTQGHWHAVHRNFEIEEEGLTGIGEVGNIGKPGPPALLQCLQTPAARYWMIL